MESKEEILIVSYKQPYPLVSGAEVRVHQFLEILCKKYSVTVVYITDNIESNNDACNYIRIPFKKNSCIELFGIVSAFFLGIPLQVGSNFYPKLLNWLVINEKKYSKILFYHVKTAGYLLALSKHASVSKLFFDGCDCISLQSINAYKASRGIKKILYGIEQKRMRRYEREIYGRITNISLISDRDRSYILNNIQQNCNPVIIPNYVLDLGYKENRKQIENTITFIGKMDYQPNTNSVLYFMNQILPRIKAKYPNVRFHVIGGYASKKLQEMFDDAGVIYHGFVEDAAYYLQSSAIVIAPMVSGAGIQNKIIQSMYLECAVITSLIGADGLANLCGDELLVYTSDDRFVELLEYYLDKDHINERAEIGRRAREYVISNYGYEKVANSVYHFLDAS